MATIRPIDEALSAYTRWIPSHEAQQVIQWALDARRLIILGKRAIGGVLIGHDGPDTRRQLDFERAQRQLIAKRETLDHYSDTRGHSFLTAIGADRVDDYVSLVDIDYLGYNRGYNEIKFPFIPKEIEYNTDSTFAAIKPVARNNAKYHYTGSEDKIEFEIDWHSFNLDRYDVITKCRAVEALTKGDGYNNPPHRVILKWGTSNLLFQDHIFMVLSAPYRLVQFNKAQVNQKTGEVERTHMLPIQAYQKVTLARITSTNLKKYELEYVANKAGTSNLSLPKSTPMIIGGLR
jgi:hypothetical protein